MTASAELPGRLPRLHLVADSEQLRLPDLNSRIRAFAEAGGARLAIHLRGHQLRAAEFHRRAAECREAVEGTGSWLIVNDRVDIAMCIGARGIQLGERSLDPADARRIAGDGIVIGSSVHDPTAARAAISGGADVLLAGTIFPSASHPGREPAGTRLITELVSLDRPVIAIGGIGPGQVAEVRRAGAWGIAVISAVWNQAHPVGAVTALIKSLEH